MRGTKAGNGTLGALVVGLVMLWSAASAAAQQHTRIMTGDGERAYSLSIEVARTAQEKAFGLMEREQLADDAGMLFLYDQPQSPGSSFWMYRTRIPLDIAFVAADGEIRAIRRMPPCDSERAAACPSYAAGVPYRAALEVNAGYFEAHDIGLGDRVELP